MKFEKNNIIKLSVFVLTVLALIFVGVNIAVECLVPKLPGEKYYKKMYDLLEEKDSITLTDVVDFEFDKAYIGALTEIYYDGDSLSEKLNLESAVDIVPLDSDGLNRIIFVKDGVIVCELVYPRSEIAFSDSSNPSDGIWLTPYTEIRVVLRKDGIIFLDAE